MTMMIILKGARCSLENMTDIRCRTVRTHIPSKDTGQDVECSLEKGLICINGCSDYEIQVYCQCGKWFYYWMYN